MFEKELQFYNTNKEQLREKYHGKHVVIAGEQVIGIYDDAGTAYKETAKTIPPGSFMIREIPENTEDEVQYLSPFLVAHA
ncbi:MAG: DUF5678 domain-containing protein [Treponema sp.]|jgi:hypothetical protein|nr:DUF5678 domain-containing protein [Treponema sp.]